MTAVAAIDCGTNSIRLLIARAGGNGLIDEHREMRVVRLGEGVDATGSLSEAALARTRSALVDYAALISDADAQAVRMVATSASRDASNAAEFTAMVTGVLGVAPEVITGAQEAELSFVGAVASLPPEAVSEPLLVADIGGGSTEVVLGSPSSGRVIASHSMDIGCVRMTERHLHDDPPTAAQQAAVIADVRAALSRAGTDVALGSATRFVGVAGTVTTIVALALGMSSYDADAIHGRTVSLADVDRVTTMLLAATRAERAALPVMHPGRVDVIGGGALILRAVMEFAGVNEVTASEHDILDGIALSLLKL